MGTPASLLDLIAHGGPLRAGMDNQNLQANTGNLQANAERQRADIPLLNQQTEQAKVDTAIKQQQWKDLQAEMAAWSRMAQVPQGQSAPQPQAPAPPQAPIAPTGAPSQAPSPVGVAPQPMLQQGLVHRDVNAPAQPVPQIATPAFNPGAPAANASMVNPISSPASYAQFLQSAGVSGPYAMSRVRALVDYQKDIATMDKDQLANETTKHSMIGAALSAWQQNPSEESYQQLRSFAQSKEPEIAALLPPTAPPPNSPALSAVAGITGAHEKMLADAKQVQETATSAAAAGASAATTRKTGIESDEAQFKFDLMRNAAKGGAAPQAITDSVKNMSVFAGHPQEMQDAIDAGTLAYQGEAAHDPLNATNKALEAVKGIADRLRENSPGVVKGKAQTAADVAKATAPIEVAKAVSIANATAPIEIKKAVDTQIELAKNSGSAFASIPDPFERHAAETQYDTASKEYADKVASARQLSDLITAAQHGNKAAPGLIPIQELRGFVQRVNSQELKAVGSNAGSAMDKVEGWLKGNVEGQPIPPDILKATKELADLQEQAAKRGYDYHLQILKQKGAKVDPIQLPGDQKPGKTATAAQIQSYAAAHGISEADARKQAESEGYAVH